MVNFLIYVQRQLLFCLHINRNMYSVSPAPTALPAIFPLSVGHYGAALNDVTMALMLMEATPRTYH